MALGSKQSKLSSGKNPSRPQAPNATAKKRGNMLTYAAAAVIVIIIASIAYFLLIPMGSQGAYSLTTNKTLSMSANQTVLLQESGSAQPVAIEVANYSGSSYTFLFTKSPVLTNPVYKFTLTPGQVINVSESGSGTADMQIKLVSAANGVATVEFIPIPASFGVRSTILATVGSQSQTTTAATTTATTTAVATSTVTATTSQPTTTTNSGSYSDAQVIAAANLTTYGTLMNDLKTLYTKDSACSSAQYNATYYAELHSNATGPNNYVNASHITPYSITENVSFVSGSTYFVNYSTVSHSSITAGKILSLELNVQDDSVIAATFSGIFTGDSYSDVSSIYATQEGIAGDCGALLP